MMKCKMLDIAKHKTALSGQIGRDRALIGGNQD
jgi:hypothetical protein